MSFKALVDDIAALRRKRTERLRLRRTEPMHKAIDSVLDRAMVQLRQGRITARDVCELEARANRMKASA